MNTTRTNLMLIAAAVVTAAAYGILFPPKLGCCLWLATWLCSAVLGNMLARQADERQLSDLVGA
jgi:hypothetical protein